MELNITNQTGSSIPKEFIGLFIEDINYAVDGGLYAEMLENRNFESLDVCGGRNSDYTARYDGLYAWSVYRERCGVYMEIVQGSPVHENNPHYLRVSTAVHEAGFCNQAYQGIYMKKGSSYRVSFYARSVEYQGKIKIAVGKEKEIFGQESVEMQEGHSWVKYEAVLKAEKDVRGGQFTVILEEPGIVEFDFFSMMPEEAIFGIFRKDLAEMLKALKPGFLRFPGGCVVEGATLNNRYQFKNTLGEPEGRKHNWNRWALHMADEDHGYRSPYSHYGQTYGIGFYEYFLLCEYLGAKPLPILGVALGCQFQTDERIEPDDPKIMEYIQEYLDLIEFANGSEQTKWGAIRAKMGHPKPFHLEMIGVGNEQWEDEKSRFFERYELFEREIHKAYPDIKLIGTAGPELDSPRFEKAWEFYRSHREQENFTYAVDEHFYTTPEWFLEHTDYFDHVPRDIKIFFGEYAAHPFGWMPMNRPEGNNMDAALAEAAFLTGAGRNSDVVVMTCYAPLFARIGYTQWNPDLIWFDETKAYATPNYYVQQIFAQNLGDVNIRAENCGLPCQVSYDRKAKEVILKIVNPGEQEETLRLLFDDAWSVSDEAVQILLHADSGMEANTLEEEKIRPEISKLSGTKQKYHILPHSFTVLRISAEK